MKITGGFLPLLAGLAAKAIPILTGTALPALATGALSGPSSESCNIKYFITRGLQGQ